MNKLIWEASELRRRDLRQILIGLEIRLKGSKRYRLRFDYIVLRPEISCLFIGHRWIKTLWNRWSPWMRAKTHLSTKSVLMGKKRLALASTLPYKRMSLSKCFKKSPLLAQRVEWVPTWVSSMFLSMWARQLFLKLNLRKSLWMRMNNRFCLSKISPNSSFKTQVPFRTLQISKSSHK